MNKILIAAGFLVAATSASWAQGYVYSPAPGYGYYGPGAYQSYATPGYGYYDYAPGFDRSWNNWEWDRSSGPGRGMSAESQR